MKSVELNPGGVKTWFVNSTGGPMAAWGEEDQGLFLLWRSAPNTKWNRIHYPAGELPEVVPAALAPDQRRLIVTNYREGPTAAVSFFDPATGRTEEIFPPGPVEPDGLHVWGRDRKPISVSYETDVRQLRFMDPAAEEIHLWLETVLPKTSRTYPDFSAGDQAVLVLAQNNRNPGIYCVANIATRKLTMLNPVYPTLNPAQMHPSRHFTFKTRDGLTITGHITLPQNIVNPPCIVLTRWNLDGPRSRDQFDREAQFFASRGIASVRINHRGTAGFGRDFLAAGDLQVATGMVDDLAEGIQWITAQGWIDRQRVAILVQGRGGWTGFPLAARPGLIKVLVNFNTLVDPASASSIQYSPVSTSGRSDGALPGGAKATKAYRETLNPLHSAEKLTIPTYNYYSRTVDSGRLPAVLKKNGKEHVFTSGLDFAGDKREARPEWEQQAMRYEQAAAFLQKHL